MLSFSQIEQDINMVRFRSADLDADPSIVLTWDELDSRLQTVWS